MEGVVRMLIGVKYLQKDKTVSPREYTYFCDIVDVQIGDILNAETVNGDLVGIVTNLDISEERISSFKDRVKTVKERAAICYDEYGNIEGYKILKEEGGNGNG